MGRKAPFFCRGQSLAEYVILMFIAATVFFGMMTYCRRGIQAVVKEAADNIGSQEDARYEKYTDYAVEENGYSNIFTNNSQKIRFSPGGVERRDMDDSTTSTGESTSISYSDKD